ncbi:MAG: DUF2226 domain-containing protein [Candidatus Altiarchaeota archaeon]
MNLLKGHHITPRNTKDFYQVCKELDVNFTGCMRLMGIVEKVLYQADILIENGDIRGASFEALGGKKVLLGDDALASIREHMAGSAGRLDIYRFDEQDMKTSLDDNQEALASSILKLSEIGVKIKSIKPKETISKIQPQPLGAASQEKNVRHSRMFGLGRITSIFGSSHTSPKPLRGDRLSEIRKGPSPHPDGAGISDKMPHVAGFGGNMPSQEEMKKAERAKEIQKGRLDAVISNPAPDMAANALAAQQHRLNQPQQGMMAAVTGTVKGMSSRKRERMEEIQRKRIVTVIKKPEEEPKIKVKSFEAGEKVETSIDRLYELVQKYKTLKVDDRLARALRVSKTQIEEWAMILEEHNLLELHYPTIGEPVIKIISKEGKE